MAERRGFEPPDQFYLINRLAGGCLQPLGHLSKLHLAEGVGFEPTELSLSGFQDRRLKPLGHPSEALGLNTLPTSHQPAKGHFATAVATVSAPYAPASREASRCTASSVNRA